MTQEKLFDEPVKPAKVLGIAAFDPTGTYRYLLSRVGDPSSTKRILWVMLNPSTATAEKDDPTIRKITKFSTRWGYGVIRICNIFALRSTDPKALKIALKEGRDPIGPENNRYIGEEVEVADRVVCAWGAHGSLIDRDLAVYDLIRRWGKVPVALNFTSDGRALGETTKKPKRRQPVHPLYQLDNTEPVEWHGETQMEMR